MPQRIGIIGMGPIGGILAAHLAAAGHRVYAVDIRSNLVTALNEGGIVLEGSDPLHVHISHAFESIADLSSIELDHLVVATKTIDMDSFIHELHGFHNPRLNLIHLQNGIDPEELGATIFPRNRVFRIVVHYAGKACQAGHYQMSFFHPPNLIGGLVPESEATAVSIAKMITNTGLTTQMTHEIKREAWFKSILNSAIMPISVITEMTMGAIMDYEPTRRIVGNTFKEILRVAAAEGFHFDEHFYENGMAYLAKAGEHKTSMLMDYQAGRSLELRYLNERILQYADKHGITCPINETQIAAIKGLLKQRALTFQAQCNRRNTHV